MNALQLSCNGRRPIPNQPPREALNLSAINSVSRYLSTPTMALPCDESLRLEQKEKRMKAGENVFAKSGSLGNFAIDRDLRGLASDVLQDIGFRSFSEHMFNLRSWLATLVYT